MHVRLILGLVPFISLFVSGWSHFAPTVVAQAVPSPGVDGLGVAGNSVAGSRVASSNVDGLGDKESPPTLTREEQESKFRKQWDDLTGPIHRGHGKVRKSGSRIVFELGDQYLGEEVRVEFTLQSEINTPLHLRSTPSCGCTLGFPEEFELPSDRPLTVRSIMRLPKSPRLFTSTIRCFDAELQFEFIIALTANIVGDFAAQPSLLNVEEKGEVEREIFVQRRLESLKVLSCNATLGNGQMNVLSCTMEPTGVRLKIVVSPPKDLHVFSDVLGLELQGEQGGEKKTFHVSVPVYYTGRVAVKPHRCLFKESPDQYTTVLFLTSQSIQWEGISAKDIVCQFVSKETDLPPIQITKIVAKPVGATLFLSVPETSRLSSLSNSEDSRILISSMKGDWSAEVPFTILE